MVVVVTGLAFTELPDRACMSVGENRLAPFALIEFCQRKPIRCRPSRDIHQVILDDRTSAELVRIQNRINADISPLQLLPDASDTPWADDVTVGTCHDYALTKRSRLIDLGYPSSALLLAMAYIPGGEAHLVLVVVTNRGDYVLDNLQRGLVRWDHLPYRWVMRSKPENLQFWQAIVPHKRTVSYRAHSSTCPASAFAWAP